jgi:hypothetical protein
MIGVDPHRGRTRRWRWARMNHAVHMAAVTQVRYKHSDGRAYYDKKLAEGKTRKQALRALKRQVSDAIYQHLKTDAARAAATAGAGDPGGQAGNDSVASAAGSHPGHRLFGQATPGPASTLRSPPRSREDRPHPRRAACRAPWRGRLWPARSSCPRGRRGSGVKAGRQAVAAGDAQQPGGRRDGPVACAERPEEHSGGEAASIFPLDTKRIRSARQ